MTEVKQQKSRLFGFLIILSIFLPMVVAYLMFKTGWGVSGNTTNKGQLLQPAQAVADLTLADNESVLKNLYPADKKKWRILVPVTASCNDHCQSNLYITRQVHIRLAEKAYRLERIFVLLDEFENEAIQKLESEHPNIITVQSTKENLQEWLKSISKDIAVEDNYYLIDQEGFAMMHYSSANTGHDLLDDIKKLLKFTYEK